MMWCTLRWLIYKWRLDSINGKMGPWWHIWLLVVGRWSKTARRLILDRELSADFESVWVSVGEETRLDGGGEGGLNEVLSTKG